MKIEIRMDYFKIKKGIVKTTGELYIGNKVLKK